MSKTPKLSILVPIYNVEKYLPQCLDSLRTLRHKNQELIDEINHLNKARD